MLYLLPTLLHPYSRLFAPAAGNTFYRREVNALKAIIMAGGKGTRLLPVSESAPKPMTRLLGLPLLEHIMILLKNNGFTELCLTLGHKAEVITEYFGDGERLGLSLTYHLEEEPLGTAGGVRACMDFIDGEDFLVISGDAACDFDLGELFERHRRDRSVVTMALFPHEKPLPYGTVVTDRRGRIVSFIEKPSWGRVVTDLVNTGVYALSPDIMDMIPENQPYDFARDLFPALSEQDMLMTGLPMSGYWCDVGDSGSYLRCSMDALDGKLRVSPAAGDRLFTGRGVHRLENDVVVVAPCLISRGAELGRGAVIEHSVIHPGSRIGAWSRVRNSVVDGGSVGEACIVEGTVICRGAQIFPMSVTRRGDVVARDGAALPPPPAAPVREPHRERGLCRELACAGRAELMRRMSSLLWEAGADFSDGISLKDGKCRVRIYPLAEESAISIEATGGREKDRLVACEKYSAIAESFGGVAKSAEG